MVCLPLELLQSVDGDHSERGPFLPVKQTGMLSLGLEHDLHFSSKSGYPSIHTMHMHLSTLTLMQHICIPILILSSFADFF